MIVSLLHRDDALLVVDKPAGLVVEPGLGHRRDSLLNGLMAAHGDSLSLMGPSRDWGLLHRLDRETSGCVLVALRPAAYDSLREQFESRRVRKSYLAIVNGRPRMSEGVVDTALEEVRRGDLKVSVPGRRGAGRPAVTRYRVLASTKSQALLLVSIDTGRLHQIRAHLAGIGHPIEGDRIYRTDLPPNTSRPPPGREAPPLLLHAWRLGFSHPESGRAMEAESPPPRALAERVRAMTGNDLAPLLPSARSIRNQPESK